MKKINFVIQPRGYGKSYFEFKQKVKELEKIINKRDRRIIHLENIITKQDKRISHYVTLIENLKAFSRDNDAVGILIDLDKLANILMGDENDNS